MRILVINTGSSSIKYQLFDMDRGEILASGLAERIGEAEGLIRHKTGGAQPQEVDIREAIADHEAGLQRIVDLLTDAELGTIADKADIDAVGHRFVHGGHFTAPTLIDDEVVADLERTVPLAPLHSPPNLIGIKVALALFPEAAQVAVFDTAFHQTMPPEAYMYALPRDLYEQHGVRRYGFHGTSHWYVTEKSAEFLGVPQDEVNLITIHLGNGASMAAVRGGRCVDTSMGLTPLEGLVMGTRSGDVDPALPFFLANHLGMTNDEIDTLLNKRSGLKGLCGYNDMREVIAAAEGGDDAAGLALGIYAHRIRKYIGAYLAELGRLDAVVFTAGIGENAPQVRAMCIQGLGHFGLAVDPERNAVRSPQVREINPEGAAVKVLVTPTNEELKIALETQKLLQGSRD